MITTGVTGGGWRASVTEWGAVEPWDGGPTLDWCVAADDRWHVPSTEAGVRQQRLGGTAVVATRLRIPQGEAIQRVYSVADSGGLTIVEVENASPLPIAVAVTRGDVLTAIPPTASIAGIELPPGSIVLPVGHRSTVRLALAHDGRGRGVLPPGLPDAPAVVRGWSTVTERAGRLTLPEGERAAQIAAVRCELSLNGPEVPDDDPVGFLLGVGQLVRMGEHADEWVPDVAFALELLARSSVRDWTVEAAIDAAAVVLRAADEARAVRDLAAMRATLVRPGPLPSTDPEHPARLVAWLERRLVAPDAGSTVLLGAGFPESWLGVDFEVHGLPTDSGGTLSYAVRWHGRRPAVLWEQVGPPTVLRAPIAGADWRTGDERGEALWPEPSTALGGVTR